MNDEQKLKHAIRAATLVREAIQVADEAGLDVLAAHLETALDTVNHAIAAP